jgi:hypothetical protein
VYNSKAFTFCSKRAGFFIQRRLNCFYQVINTQICWSAHHLCQALAAARLRESLVCVRAGGRRRRRRRPGYCGRALLAWLNYLEIRDVQFSSQEGCGASASTWVHLRSHSSVLSFAV